MTAIVRIFTHSELVIAPVASSGGRFSSDSVAQLKQPYLGKEKLTAGTGAAVNSDPLIAPRATKLALVQVQSGKTVHYEVTTGNVTDIVVADDTSPTMSGDTVIQFGDGWRLSFLETTE